MNEIKDYINFLKIDKKYSINTYASYNKDLHNFLIFLKDKNELSKATEDDIKAYLKKIKPSRADRSISHVLSSLRGFYKYLMIERIITTNPISNIESPKLSKTLPKVLSVEEVDKLLDIKLEGHYSYRNKAILELMYATGMRVSETINIKLHDLDLENASVRTIGKGSKERIIPLGDYAISALRIYISNHRPFMIKNTYSDYLFLNSRGDKLTRKSIFVMLRAIAKEKGIKTPFSPHTLRHSFASHLLNGGADLRSIQELLGHVDISSTQIYTHISKDKLKRNYNEFHPHGKK